MMGPGIVSIGAEQAAVAAAEALRDVGYDGRITLLGDEPYGPYHRPPLSKSWLADQLARATGLACECGIVVDACGRTADPLIVAAGDCTARRMDNGELMRLE